MKGKPVPNEDHILRYIGGMYVDQDSDGNWVILGGAFLARPRDENALSVNWLEVFEGRTEQRVAEVRLRRRLNYGKTARLARLNVGSVLRHLADNLDGSREVAVIHDPLEAEEDKPADPSHALMRDIPDQDNPEGELIGDLIAQCVIESFPAVLPE